MVHSRNIKGKEYTFGISGRLYKSNVLLYDHQTESLWSQLMEKAISGPLVNTKLKEIPSTRTSWKSWKRKNPNTLVLSTNTGYRRDYTIDPYKGYYRALGIMFPVGNVRKDLSSKEMVLGIEIEGQAKAYSISVLQKKPGILQDSIGKVSIEIEVDPDGEVAEVRDSSGKSIPTVFNYWFAWQAFHPTTEVYGIDR